MKFILRMWWFLCFFYLLLTASKLAWICLGLHLIADFCLQGILANMKQRSWWEEQFEKFNVDEKHRELYKDDWEVGLYCHAMMWSIITFFPLMFLVNSTIFSLIIVTNMFIHRVVDDLKANEKIFSLFNDQVMHFLQVMITVYIVLA